MTDELDEILSKQDWGYEYQMSDYATSKAAELEYEREGKAKIAELKQAIQALIAKECTKARIEELEEVIKRNNYGMTKSQLGTLDRIAELSNKEVV